MAIHDRLLLTGIQVYSMGGQLCIVTVQKLAVLGVFALLADRLVDGHFRKGLSRVNERLWLVLVLERSLVGSMDALVLRSARLIVVDVVAVDITVIILDWRCVVSVLSQRVRALV